MPARRRGGPASQSCPIDGEAQQPGATVGSARPPPLSPAARLAPRPSLGRAEGTKATKRGMLVRYIARRSAACRLGRRETPPSCFADSRRRAVLAGTSSTPRRRRHSSRANSRTRARLRGSSARFTSALRWSRAGAGAGPWGSAAAAAAYKPHTGMLSAGQDRIRSESDAPTAHSRAGWRRLAVVCGAVLGAQPCDAYLR